MHHASFSETVEQVSLHLCSDEHCFALVLTPADLSGKGNGK